MDLTGTTAIVTGGNGGLGQRICRALARAGANVAVVYNVSEDQARGVAAELRESGVQAEAFQCDVRSPEQVDALVSAVLETFGRLDILVNDAAYNIWIPFSDMDALTFEEWTKILDTNLTGPMLCTKAVAGPMRRGGAGRIVNISSIAGLGPQGSSIAYAVSKAGLIHLTRCMALGLAPEILVNCVAPGYIEGTRATANPGSGLPQEGAGVVRAQDTGRQGRHRRPGSHPLPQRHDHRPDGGRRLRPLLPLATQLD